jgi:hypothetical protein
VFLPDASGVRVDTLKHRAPTRLDLEEIVTSVAIRAIRWLERHSCPDRRVRWLGSLVDTTNGCVGIATDGEMKDLATWITEHHATLIDLQGTSP